MGQAAALCPAGPASPLARLRAQQSPARAHPSPEVTTERPRERGKKNTPAEVPAGHHGTGCGHTVPRWGKPPGTCLPLQQKLQMRMSTVSSKRTSRQPRRKKVANITLDGGFYGMAVWDDAVDLYLRENTAEDGRPSLRYTIDTATGGVGKASRWIARLPQPGTMTLPLTRKTAQTFGSETRLPGWTAPPVN